MKHSKQKLLQNKSLPVLELFKNFNLNNNHLNKYENN
jgi:hypothetical protein